ncbi:hypothetical protein QBC45DRAFT_379588 [Copromyces sp. CBS 386.78]|nr:hypothetical protein QBC45DRAFT_379588 [Copromyces sp. CBS 386.78]
MSRRYPDKRYYDDDRGQPPRPPGSQIDQRDTDSRRERDYPPLRYSSRESSSYGSSRNTQDRDRDRRNPPPNYDRPRSEYGRSRNDRQRSRSPPPNPRIINNHQPGGLRSGRLSPPRREQDSGRNGSRSGRNSPAPSTTSSSGSRTPAHVPARTAQPSRVPSRASSRVPSPVRSRQPDDLRSAPAPRPAQVPRPAAAAPAQAIKPKGFPAPVTKTNNTRNTFHFLELSLLPNSIIHDSHILQDLAKCMDECEREDANTPWEEQERGKEFLKWFDEYRSSVATLRPTVPDMRDHAMVAMKDMIKKGLTRKKLFTELYPLPPKEEEGEEHEKIVDGQIDGKDKKRQETAVQPNMKPTIDVQTDVICLLRPAFTKRNQYITFAPYHDETPSNVLITTSPALTNLAGSHPLTLTSALPVLSGLKRIAFLWDSASPPNGPGPLPADLAFLFPGNLPSLETMYILHPEIRPRSEWFWVSPECDTFRGGPGGEGSEGMGSEALFVEVREVDVEGIGTGTGKGIGTGNGIGIGNGNGTGNGKKSMWEVLGEENGGGREKRDVWGRGLGGGEVKVSEGVRDALREVKALEAMYHNTCSEGNKNKDGKGVKVKLMGCIPVKN